ncbi:MAG: phosphomannomutase/phosphoglucomutase [Gammaproteobacteria bacterium]|jgi:phosphomannomutase/phosphoglucomutase
MASLADLSNRLPKRVLALIGGAVLVVLVSIYAISTVLEKIAVAERDAQIVEDQTIADHLARELGAVLEPQRQKLNVLAQQPAIVGALSAEKTQREKAAAAAQNDIPGALYLRLLPRGADHVDPNSRPPLTFASVDMLRDAGKSDRDVKAELHLGGTDNEHIVMIQRVPIAGEAVGFLHLSVDPKLVRDALANLTGVPGYIEVRQPVPKGPPTIIARSGSPPIGDATSAIAGISGTVWVVSYRAATAATVTSSDGGGMLPFIGLLAIVVLLGCVVFFLRRRDAELSSDAVTYQGAIKAILEGAHPGLEQLLPGELQTLATNIGPVSAGITDDDRDDITEFGAVDDAAAAAAAGGDTFDITGETTSGIEVVEGDPDGPAHLDPSIFRTYDIRGIVGETLTPEGIYEIGRALGSEAAARGQQTIVTARDGRNSSQEIRDALIEGLRDSGRDVLDIGLTPTPVLYFATHYLDSHSGVMITGSHNPPEYNGLKIVLDGETLSGEAIQAIRERIENNDFTSGEGTMQSAEIIPDYIRRISEEIPVTLGNALKVVVDCGNSVPGIAAPHILRAIGHDVIELYCEVDGNFPNHHPDPSQPENLADLIRVVEEEAADLGLAFDGDGDRLGVVDNAGNIIWPDSQMILFARDVLSRNPGAKIIYDVKCSRLLADDIRANGGEPIMSRSGHSLIKTKMQETGALLAGEMSGHIFFKERWYGFDDALYCAARLLEIIVNSGMSATEVFDGLPGGVATPELKLDLPEAEHAAFMQKVLEAANFGDAEITTLDGLRVDFSDSWGLVRPSNTTPCLVLRFEGDDQAALDKVQQLFRDLLLGVDGDLNLPF